MATDLFIICTLQLIKENHAIIMMHLFRFYSYEHMAGDFSHEMTCQENLQTYYAPEFTNIYITRFVKNKTSRTSRTNTAADNKSTIFPIFHFLNSPASDDKFSYPLFNRLPDVYVTGYSISHMKANLTFLARKITPRLPSSDASATI